MAKKSMLGPRIRRLRREHSLTQAEMATRLSISASYLNLIENNHRPVTVDLLLRLGQSFDVDLQSFAEDDAGRLVADLNEVFSDPLFAQIDVKRHDLSDLAGSVPTAAQAMITLYRAYREARENLALLSAQGDGGAAPVDSPRTMVEEVRDFFERETNYFPDLETAAEEVWQAGKLDPAHLWRGLTEFLERELNIRVKTMPIEVMGTVRRRYDRHGRRLLISEMLPMPSRTFHLAVQIGLIRYHGLIDKLTEQAGFVLPEAADLARLGLANHFAAAVLMPYDRFYRAATAVRYDIDVLERRFEATFEQVCHRLTTLQRPGAKGIPFFMIRIDNAGNVSKRFSATGLHFARFGGACPRWNVHDAFSSPSQIHIQVSEMTDGARYFSVARTVSKPGAGYHQPGQTFAVALGCELSYAAQLIYADGVDLQNDDIAVPIGLQCRLCERRDCVQRAFPPANHPLTLDESVRGASPYHFDAE